MALAQLISSLTAVAAKLLQTAAHTNDALNTGQVNRREPGANDHCQT